MPEQANPGPRVGDEFYIGYASPAPPRIARASRRAALLVVLVAIAAAASLGWTLRSASPGHWSTEVIELRGVLSSRPFPTLLLAEPAALAPGSEPTRRVILVGEGKCGLFHSGSYCTRSEQLAGDALDGRSVRIRGTALRRGGVVAIEVPDAPGALMPVQDDLTPAVSVQSFGIVRLSGEVIDLKCALGAMSPGEGKVHKACAIRCVQGGIPAALLVKGGTGGLLPRGRDIVLLRAAESRAGDAESLSRWISPFVGEQVELTGSLDMHDDVPVLSITPTDVTQR